MLSLVCVKSFNRLMANVRLREHVQFSVQNQRSLGYPLQLTCLVLCYFFELASLWQVNKTTKTKQNCSFCGHCPLCTRRRFIGALVPEAPIDHCCLDLTKPTTFLRLQSPSHEKCANDKRRPPSCPATFYSHALLICTPDGNSLNSGVFTGNPLMHSVPFVGHLL